MLPAAFLLLRRLRPKLPPPRFRSHPISGRSHSPILPFHFPSLSRAVQSLGERPQRAQYPTTNLCVYLVHHILKLSDSSVPNSFVSAVVAHCLAVKIGALAHMPIATSLLSFYSKAGLVDDFQALFNEILDKDIIFWNSMITAYIHNQLFGQALDCFVKMVRDGHGFFDSTTLLLAISALSRPDGLKQGRNVHSLTIKSGWLLDTNLCNALMDMYAKCRDLSSSESVFAEMGLRDIVSWNTVISGCLFNCYPDKTLWYFKEMANSGERADNESLSCVVAASASLGAMSCGEAIHSWGFKLAFNNGLHISVANSLITFYSQCGDIERAENVFREMVSKDVVSWNAMIGGFAANEMMLEAFDALYKMQLAHSLQPDIATVLSTTSLCAAMMLLREGQAIHGYVIRRQMKSYLSVTNSLIDMYSKCMNVGKAELLFNITPVRDIVSWNSMISGYSRNGNCSKAQKLFKELLCCGSQCNLSTLLAILPSSTSRKGLHFGESIHCWQLKLGFSDSILAINSLMHMYACCGDLAAAFSLLPKASLLTDVSCWNTLILGCMNNSRLQEALETFNLMRLASSTNPDSITFVNVISACGKLELVREGKAIHALSLKTLEGSDARVQNALITMYGRYQDIESARLVFYFNSNCNLCSWNCMISALSQNKNGRKALELFLCLEQDPDEITFVGILSACTELGFLRHGKQIHGYTLRNGFQNNSFISAALLDMYSSCGRLDLAAKVFRNSSEITTEAWNSMISAYGYHSHGRKAIDLFHEMSDSGHRATKSTFVSLLSACSHSGLVDEGLCYYDSMLEVYEVEPVTDHHVCVVDMLGRSGRLLEAFDFIKQMQSLPEPGVWGALLSACNYQGEIGIGREVAELLFAMDPQNTGYYISLSNMYSAAGVWKEAVELRNIVEYKQLKKPAGYSLIDVGS